MKAGVLALLAVLAAVPAGRAAEAEWPSEETPHFVVHHELPGASLAEDNLLERIYDGLHPALWRLVPWMAEEKTHVYIYKDPASYRAGRFSPPAWSAGLLHLADGEKAVAIFVPVDPQTLAHELAHLYLHAFFAEKSAQPPAWLDEGLATMLQDSALSLPDPRRKGPVLRSIVPLDRFLKTRPASDAPAGWVDAWYRQSASLVWFLRTAHVEGGFDELCRALRDGDGLEAALSSVYGYEELAAFERAWLQWRPRKPVGALNDLNDQ